jgi:hypothetical protein
MRAVITLLGAFATTAALSGATRAVEWGRTPKGETLPFAWPAGPGDLRVDHAGTGRPWVTVQARAAVVRRITAVWATRRYARPG